MRRKWKCSVHKSTQNFTVSFKRGEISDRLHWYIIDTDDQSRLKRKQTWTRLAACYCSTSRWERMLVSFSLTSCLPRGFFIFIPQASVGATCGGKSHFSLFLKRPYACFLFSVCNESLRRINIWSFSLSPRRSFLWESEEVWTGSDQRDVTENTPHVN